MAFDITLLKPNPPASPVVPPAPGLVFIKTIPMSFPGFSGATTYSTITVDAPGDANFTKYRGILFRFYGIGFANGTGSDLRIQPRRSGQNITNSLNFQINQISSATATGWINTSGVAPQNFTTGSPVTSNNPLNKLDILMHPVGYEIDFSFGSNTTLFAGAMGKSTGTYTLASNLLTPTMLRDNPGLTLSLSAANFFTSWNSNSSNADLPMTCDIYGYCIA